MLRLLRKKRAQSTAEYAILIGLVVAALVGMQIYIRRGLNAKIKDGVDVYTDNAIAGNKSVFHSTQYEPYYSNQTVHTTSGQTEGDNMLDTGVFTRISNATTNRTTNQTYGWDPN